MFEMTVMEWTSWGCGDVVVVKGCLFFLFLFLLSNFRRNIWKRNLRACSSMSQFITLHNHFDMLKVYSFNGKSLYYSINQNLDYDWFHYTLSNENTLQTMNIVNNGNNQINLFLQSKSSVGCCCLGQAQRPALWIVRWCHCFSYKKLGLGLQLN